MSKSVRRRLHTMTSPRRESVGGDIVLATEIRAGGTVYDIRVELDGWQTANLVRDLRRILRARRVDIIASADQTIAIAEESMP